MAPGNSPGVVGSSVAHIDNVVPNDLSADAGQASLLAIKEALPRSSPN